jgi:imidazolonepropionase-like amidohydrolase
MDPRAEGAPLVLRNATVVDVDAGARPNATITIAGARIQAVDFGAAPQAPPGARIVDLRGASLLPGLFNCHYHATYKNIGASGGVFVPIGMEAPPALQALRAAHHVAQALDAGFTGLVGAGGPYAVDVSLKLAIEEGLIRGPRIMAGSRDVSTTAHLQDRATPWHWGLGDNPGFNRCDGADAFRRGVREEVKRGAEIIKVFLTCGHPDAPHITAEMDLTSDELAAAIETAQQCGVKIRAHTARRSAVWAAVTLGIDLVDHGDGLDEACIELMLQKGTFLAPSMLFPHRLAELASGAFADGLKRSADHMLEVLPLANRAGLKIVLGDDFGATPLQHGDYADELDFYVNHVGIPPLDVLRWATRHGAELMGLGQDLGSIRVGALADLVVVDGDPIADIRVLKRKENILAVLKDGRFEKDRLGALDQRAASAAQTAA